MHCHLRPPDVAPIILRFNYRAIPSWSIFVPDLGLSAVTLHYAVTLISGRLTLDVCSVSVLTSLNSAPNFSKIENLRLSYSDLNIENMGFSTIDFEVSEFHLLRSFFRSCSANVQNFSKIQQPWSCGGVMSNLGVARHQGFDRKYIFTISPPPLLGDAYCST